MMNRGKQSAVVMALTALLIGGLAGVASATILAQDNFDNVAVGAAPVPTVGTRLNTWYSAKAGAGMATAPSAPNYLDNYRLDASGISEYGYAVAFDGGAQAPGASIHVEFQNYGVNGAQYWMLGLVSNDYVDPWTYNHIIQLAGDYYGNVLALGSASWADTGLDYTHDTWETWEIDYVVGQSTYKLTVGGNSVDLSGATYMLEPAASQAAVFRLTTGHGDSRSLMDDLLITPEPATLALLGLGMTLIRRRR